MMLQDECAVLEAAMEWAAARADALRVSEENSRLPKTENFDHLTRLANAEARLVAATSRLRDAP